MYNEVVVCSPFCHSDRKFRNLLHRDCEKFSSIILMKEDDCNMYNRMYVRRFEMCSRRSSVCSMDNSKFGEYIKVDRLL